MNEDNKNKEWSEFKSGILHLKENRKHKVTKSLGVYDAYKFIRKNKWLNIGRMVTEHEFYSIIRNVNKQFVNNLLEGYDIKLPYRMGIIELRKRNVSISISEGKIKTTLPVDWDKTIKLWHEDEESYKNKTLVKMEEKEVYKIYYNKSKSNYKNKTLYEFRPNRELKIKVKQKIKDGCLDGYLIKRNNYEME